VPTSTEGIARSLGSQRQLTGHAANHGIYPPDAVRGASVNVRLAVSPLDHLSLATSPGLRELAAPDARASVGLELFWRQGGPRHTARSRVPNDDDLRDREQLQTWSKCTGSLAVALNLLVFAATDLELAPGDSTGSS